MTTDSHDPEDGLPDFEAELKALRPRGLPQGFADRVAVEARLREVSPAEPSEGFADRVVAASLAEPAKAGRIIPFVRKIAPFAAAAAVALALLPVLSPKVAPESEIKTAAAAVPAALVADAPEIPAEALHLPVVNLPDGRAFRPVIRRNDYAGSEFRATPGGVIMPVSLPASAAVSFEPVVFE